MLVGKAATGIVLVRGPDKDSPMPARPQTFTTIPTKAISIRRNPQLTPREISHRSLRTVRKKEERMAKIPVITSPCPLRFNSMPQSGKDFCGQCKRRVHNLDGMDDSQREAFFAACSGEVCVSFSVRRSAPRVAALSLAALGAAASISAAEVTINNPPSPYCDPAALDIVIMGGTNSEALRWVDESEAAVSEQPDLLTIEASDWLPTPDESA
jgi:hypothetical protein